MKYRIFKFLFEKYIDRLFQEKIKEELVGPKLLQISDYEYDMLYSKIINDIRNKSIPDYNKNFS